MAEVVIMGGAAIELTPSGPTEYVKKTISATIFTECEGNVAAAEPSYVMIAGVVIPVSAQFGFTERELAGTAWTEGVPDPNYDATTDYFEDVLFETTGLFAQPRTTWTECSG